MAKPLVKLQFFKKHVGVNPCGNCILVEKFFSRNPFKQKLSRTFFLHHPHPPHLHNHHGLIKFGVFAYCTASCLIKFGVFAHCTASCLIKFGFFAYCTASWLIKSVVFACTACCLIKFGVLAYCTASCLIKLVFLLIVPLVGSSNLVF